MTVIAYDFFIWSNIISYDSKLEGHHMSNILSDVPKDFNLFLCDKTVSQLYWKTIHVLRLSSLVFIFFLSLFYIVNHRFHCQNLRKFQKNMRIPLSIFKSSSANSHDCVSGNIRRKMTWCKIRNLFYFLCANEYYRSCVLINLLSYM